MKKACISFFGILIIVLLAAFYGGSEKVEKRGYLRIHVRANSNELKDQSIKYEIKDMIVAYLTPKLGEVASKSQAQTIIENEKDSVNRLIDGFLAENGFAYKSSVAIRNEKFPTRVYEDLTLEEGFYDAVIVELGKAEGDNWWCVVYPPLCFTGEKVTYRSIIADLIRKYIK